MPGVIVKRNKNARYEPDWHHSTRLELVIWSAPLLIIICLGALTWLGTHLLDPIARSAVSRRASPSRKQHKPLEVNVIALDWKWLFIYPEYGIATINELAVPVDRPVKMRITAEHVMNSLYVPEMAGMVYAMPGMETQLHGVLNKPVASRGFLDQLQRRRFLRHEVRAPGCFGGRVRRVDRRSAQQRATS